MLEQIFILFGEFFKTGLFAVGGGLATIPFLKEIAEKYYERFGWFSVSQLTDMIAVSESTPGPIGVNMATFAGFNAGYAASGVLSGILCGAIATLSLVAPSFIIILIVAKFLEKFKDNKYVDAAFYGIRPCSASLIAAAILDVLLLSLFKGGVLTDFNFMAGLLFVVLLPLVIKLKKLHPIVFIAAGAVFGIIFKL